MKVLMIAPTPFFADRGCHVRILEETLFLKKLGVDVVISTYHNGRNISGLKIKRILNIPWYKKLEAGPSIHKIYLDMLLLFSSSKLLKDKPDIIHAHLHEGIVVGNLLNKLSRRNIPLIFDAQGSLVREMVAHNFIEKNGIVYSFFYRLEKILSKIPDAIITSTKQMANILNEDFDVNRDKVFVVPDGVNVDFFRPGLDTRKIQHQLKISNYKKIIVYLGLLNKYQGVDLLLDSIPHVVRETKDIHFIIMGYPNVKVYVQKSRKLNVDKYVTFTGRINYFEAPLYLNLGDVAVSPKITLSGEGNVKLLNYMACGLPTVVFDFHTNREILGDAGVYVRDVSANAFADKIVELVMDDSKRQELSLKARKRAVEEFSWLKNATKIKEIYESLLDRSIA